MERYVFVERSFGLPNVKKSNRNLLLESGESSSYFAQALIDPVSDLSGSQ